MMVTEGEMLYCVLWSPIALFPWLLPTSFGKGNAGVGGVRMTVGNFGVVARGPSQRGEVVARKDRRAEVNEAAS